MPDSEMPWFSVRCLYELWGSTYEERICLWQADSFADAITQAEQEALGYAAELDATYLGLAQAYELPETPSSGGEIFSLIRESDLSPSEYVIRFFDTGTERQQALE
jgi:hypothetical protein